MVCRARTSTQMVWVRLRHGSIVACVEGWIVHLTSADGPSSTTETSHWCSIFESSSSHFVRKFPFQASSRTILYSKMLEASALRWNRLMDLPSETNQWPLSPCANSNIPAQRFLPRIDAKVCNRILKQPLYKYSWSLLDPAIRAERKTSASQG